MRNNLVRPFPLPSSKTIRRKNLSTQASANPRAAAATLAKPTRVFLRLEIAELFVVPFPPVALGAAEPEPEPV